MFLDHALVRGEYRTTGKFHQKNGELLAEVARYSTAVDLDLVTRAFRYAAAAHEGQQRRSGSGSAVRCRARHRHCGHRCE